MKSKKGFTLIELLVVISIIAVLMSIMMPALSKVRESGKSVVCKSNLKSILISAALWSEDNEGWALGMSWSWPDPPFENAPMSNFTSLISYSNSVRNQTEKNIYACPSAKGSGFFGVESGSDVNGMGTLDPKMAEKTITYGINSWISSARQNEGPGTSTSDPAKKGSFGEGPGYVHWYQHGVTKIAKIRQPEQTVYFMDYEFYSVTEDNFDPFKAPSTIRTNYALNGIQTRWHSRKSGEWYGYANIGWVDGHASKEPDDFDEPAASGLFREPRWTYYFWNH